MDGLGDLLRGIRADGALFDRRGPEALARPVCEAVAHPAVDPLDPSAPGPHSP
ncbi:hypothetical protein [Embleya sp. NBC_00896]|uniref:hypothetical protein n=1 Tax=Embleya sp. NBC_00896 TaxID=2975961 RepID=UPI003863B2CD|nr:hypothetical protein OG928_28045 [Embleya sp. NBC_00896]